MQLNNQEKPMFLFEIRTYFRYVTIGYYISYKKDVGEQRWGKEYIFCQSSHYSIFLYVLNPKKQQTIFSLKRNADESFNYTTRNESLYRFKKGSTDRSRNRRNCANHIDEIILPSSRHQSTIGEWRGWESETDFGGVRRKYKFKQTAFSFYPT